MNPTLSPFTDAAPPRSRIVLVGTHLGVAQLMHQLAQATLPPHILGTVQPGGIYEQASVKGTAGRLRDFSNHLFGIVA